MRAKNCIIGRIFEKIFLNGEVNQAVQRIYPPLQQKTVTPTEQQQEITADTGVYGLSKVTVDPIPGEYIVPEGNIEITESGTYDVTNKASAIVNIGGSYPPDWSEIGYENTPQTIIDGFNYAKEIKENWDNTITTATSMFATNNELLIMPNVYTGNITKADFMFDGCGSLISIPQFNMSKVNDFSYLFRNCTNLRNVSLFDISSATSIRYMFAGCNRLKSIPAFDNGTGSSNLTAQGAFNNCKDLVDVPVMNFSRVGPYSNSIQYMFSGCPNLSEESLNNIMETCITITQVLPSYRTLKQIGLTSQQATTCQSLSNYQAFIDAGWTTGY